MKNSQYKITGFPSQKHEIAFDVYRFYLKCILDFLQETYVNWESFGEKLFSRIDKLHRIKEFDISYLDRFLTIAWNIEYLTCNVDLEDISITKVYNQLKPTLVYFSIYSAGEALAHTVDKGKSTGHKKCLRKISKYIVDHGLPPWNLAYAGCIGVTKRAHCPVNFPNNLIIPTNLQRHNVKPVGMIGRCLHAEHKNRVEYNFQKKKGKRKCNFDPGYTTILHFMYRLRIKSNYQDADIFLTEAPDSYIKDFSEKLSLFCFWTLLLCEIFIIKRIGFDEISPIIERYLSVNRKARQLKRRFEFYKKMVV